MTSKKVSIFFSSVCLTMLLSACSSISSVRVDENVPVKCNTETAQFQMYTPEQHYQAMLVCLKEKDRDLTVVHYAMAGATTWYDAKVSGDNQNKLRHQNLLKQYIKKANPQEKAFLGNAIRQVTDDRALLSTLCQLVKSRPGVAVTQSVLAEQYWKEAVDGYLRCPDTNS